MERVVICEYAGRCSSDFNCEHAVPHLELLDCTSDAGSCEVEDETKDVYCVNWTQIDNDIQGD